MPSTGISNDLIIITARRIFSANGSAKPVPPFGGGITEAVILDSHSRLVSDVSVFGCQRQKGGAHNNPNVAEFLNNTQVLRVVNSFCQGVARGNCRGAEDKTQQVSDTGKRMLSDLPCLFPTSQRSHTRSLVYGRSLTHLLRLHDGGMLAENEEKIVM